MKFAPQRWSGSTRFYLLGILVAVELLMSFSFRDISMLNQFQSPLPIFRFCLPEL